ncbi:hypothetical protein V1478_015916 [Vespula squamosa]|uniref:PiggyBac transposable element-derived protein 4 C-terminal zinc-ribbon domain-containing protein n=1 Tax=Vespula squamosa TaxID=30214 RepID=A0ABD2A277_VESSQ
MECNSRKQRKQVSESDSYSHDENESYVNASLREQRPLNLFSTSESDEIEDINLQYIDSTQRHSFNTSINSTDDNPTRLVERHFPTSYTSDRKNKVRRCTVCSKNNMRRESRYECKECNVGLCICPSGLATWHVTGDRSNAGGVVGSVAGAPGTTDEVFLAAQEAAQAHRDSQEDEEIEEEGKEDDDDDDDNDDDDDDDTMMMMTTIMMMMMMMTMMMI